MANERQRNGLSTRPSDRQHLHALLPYRHRRELPAHQPHLRPQNRGCLRHPDVVLRGFLELLAQRSAANAHAAAVFLRPVFCLPRHRGLDRGPHRDDPGHRRRHLLHPAGAGPLDDGVDLAWLHPLRRHRLPPARHRRHFHPRPSAGRRHRADAPQHRHHRLTFRHRLPHAL